MPYEIKHKSHNACLIKYTHDKASRGFNSTDLTVVTAAVIALMMGIPIIIVGVITVLLFSFGRNKSKSFKPNFEIELSRPKNRISIRNSEQLQPRTVTHTLSYFKGIVVNKSRNLKTSTGRVTRVNLFLKFEQSSGLIRNIPIRNRAYPVSIQNAEDIIAAVEDWLALEDIPNIDETMPEPEPEPEILRDFRDMD